MNSVLNILIVTFCLCWFSNNSAGQVRLVEDAVDESAGHVPCYKIETPSATYFLEKEGMGLSSMLDKDGNDWISFHKEPGSGAAGEYRGFPNAVYKQDGSFFHPRNAGTDISKSTVVRVDDEYPDNFYQMRNEMTVFGFGRKKVEKFISSVPQSFSIGFIESTKYNKLSKAVEQFYEGKL